ncbi:MAG: chorismate synthase [Anaerolineales bacterium]
MLRYLTAGESHGEALTAILDGMPADLPLDSAVIERDLTRRRQGYGAGARMEIERDTVCILGGVMGGKTTGAPIALLVENADHARWKGRPIPPMTIPRPGHADLTGALKYGYRDLRPALERASARETAMRVAVGAICRHFLAQFGLRLGGYVCAIGAESADLEGLSYHERFERSEASEMRCPDENAARRMKASIDAAVEQGATLGGIIEVVALGVPAGLGAYAQWDRRLDARLGAAVLSVPAVKGVEFGRAWESTRLLGTQVQDAMRFEGQTIVRLTNWAGGLEGGITNGQPLVVRAAMKPIATTSRPQPTVNLASGEDALSRYERSDHCPLPRAVPVLEAMLAYVLADALIEKLGGDSLSEMQARFVTLRKPQRDDLPMDNTPHVWWEVE